jgi:hypothetical protein
MSTKTAIEELVQLFAESGMHVTEEQARSVAERISGSVDAHLAFLKKVRADAAGYRPLEPGPFGVSDKFSAPIAYTLEDPPSALPAPPLSAAE